MAEAPAQTWRDKMQPASFRGVSFSVVSTEGQVGRRNALHEYPQRDLPYAEDLGRKAREFTIEGFVIGENYMAGRDKLIDALEAFGSGELVHPYRGRMQVVLSSPARISESTADGGMARFSMTFSESGEPVNPAPHTDTGAAVNAAADEAQAATEAGFFDNFSISGLQDFLPTEALATITDALDSIQSAANNLLSGGLLPEFTRQLFGFAGSVTGLMSLPGNLASGLFGQVSALAGIADNPMGGLSSLLSSFGFSSSQDDAVTPDALSALIASSSSASDQAISSTAAASLPTLNARQAAAVSSYSASVAVSALRPLFDFGSAAKPVPNSIPPTLATPNAIATPSRIQQAVNQAAVITLIRQAAVIEAAKLSTKIIPPNHADAIALRDELADKLEALAETAPDKIYMALSKLRIAVIKDITVRAADLSRTVIYMVPATLPALVVAHHLYGDVEQADAIVARNKIRHPGFVPGGRTIEVPTL